MEQQNTTDPPSPLPSGYVTRPGVVTFICITSIISMVMQILVVMLVVNAQPHFGAVEMFIAYVLVALMLGGYSVLILGLWRAKNWARMIFAVLFPLIAIMEVLANPNIVSIGRLPIVALLCILLFRPKASAFFRGEILAPIDPASGLEIGTREVIHCPSCGKEIYSDVTSCHHCGRDLNHEHDHGLPEL